MQVVAEGLAAAILMECCVQPKQVSAQRYCAASDGLIPSHRFPEGVCWWAQVVGTIELLQIQRPSGDGLPRKELAAHSATIYQVAGPATPCQISKG